MAITKPLEYDKTPIELLYRIGQRAQEEAIRKQKLDADNQAKQYAVLSQIDPNILYSKYERDIVDRSLGDLQNFAANFIKNNPNASYIILQSEINKYLAKMSSWSTKVKEIKDTIDNDVKSSDKIYDKARLRALAYDAALYNTDQNGNKVLKDESLLTKAIPWVSDVAREKKNLVIDPYTGEERLQKLIKNPALYRETSFTMSPDGKRYIQTKVASPYFWDPQKKDIKTGSSGFLDEDVFQQIYRDPSVSVFIDAEGEKYMNALGVRPDDPDLPKAREYYKRAFLTNYLRLNRSGISEMLPKSISGQQKSVSRKSSDPYVEYKNDVISAFNSRNTDQIRDVLERLSSGSGKFQFDKVAVSEDGTTAEISYFTGKKDAFGKNIFETKKIDATAPDFEPRLSGIIQLFVGANKSLETEGITGNKKQIKPTTKTGKKTGASGL